MGGPIWKVVSPNSIRKTILGIAKGIIIYSHIRDIQGISRFKGYFTCKYKWRHIICSFIVGCWRILRFIKNYECCILVLFTWINSVCCTFNPNLVINFSNKISLRGWKAHKFSHSLQRVRRNIILKKKNIDNNRWTLMWPSISASEIHYLKVTVSMSTWY